MNNPRFLVLLNLLLASVFCFSVAFVPYFLVSSGDGLLNRTMDMVGAIQDALRTSSSMAMSSFFMPFIAGIAFLVGIVITLVPRFAGKLLTAMAALTVLSVVLVVWGSFLINSVHIMVIALIPIGFALISARRKS